MSSCLRQSLTLPKKLFICNINSSSKSFSALSSLPDKHSSIYNINNLFLRGTNKPKQKQYRSFSFDSINSFFESIRTSDANKFVTKAIIGTHDFTGLSWTGTIIVATAVIKLFVGFPCGAYQQYLTSRLELTKLELNEIAKTLRNAVEKRAIKGRWTQAKFQSEFRKEISLTWKTLVVKNNCHPFKITILFLMQLPFWLLLTLTIRSIAMDAQSKDISKMENPVTAFKFQVGGPFWCQNLSLPDSTLILPTINGLSMLTMTELSFLSKAHQQLTNFFATKIFPNFLRIFSVLFFFISAASPSGVSLFWATSSLFSLGQNLLLMSPRVRRILKIPKTATEADKPYSSAWNIFVQKLQKFFLRKK